jgi:hypothetical protein
MHSTHQVSSPCKSCKQADFMPLVASLVGIVPAAPRIELLLIDKGYSGTVALLADGHFAVTLGIPGHTAGRMGYAVYLVLTIQMVDSTDWVDQADGVVVMVDSTD